MRALYLVDSVDYVESNCFQRQLLGGFRYRCDIDIFSIHREALLPFRARRLDLQKYDVIVSVLRQRTLNRLLPQIQKIVGSLPIAVYDQDPWESYIDTAPTKGFYRRLHDTLNATAFVTSSWWTDYLRADGIRAHFVRMGMEPRWCDAGPIFTDRPIEVGFKGAVHPHRRIVFDELGKNGIQVTIDARRLEYPEYMNYLHNVRVFTHDESAPWICNGEEISRSTGMLVKDVEIAARGTFVLRNWHDEAITYGLNQSPTILFYKHPDEAPDRLDELRKLSPEEIR